MVTHFPAEVLSARQAFSAALLFTRVDILLARDIGIRNLANGVAALNFAMGMPRRLITRLRAVSSRTCWMRWSRKVMPMMPFTFRFIAAM
ncbi:hypothetical protein D9M68_851770 [compost metagenome]